MAKDFSDFVQIAKASEVIWNGRVEAKSGMMAVKPDLAPDQADAVACGAEKVVLAYLKAYHDWSER